MYGDVTLNGKPVDTPSCSHCYACGELLVPVSHLGMAGDYQLDNACWVEFHGGYGMFVDPLFEPAPKVVICHDCMHHLCHMVPWVNKLLDPHSSHSHRTSYVEQNPAHFGWDYDHRAKVEPVPTNLTRKHHE